MNFDDFTVGQRQRVAPLIKNAWSGLKCPPLFSQLISDHFFGRKLLQKTKSFEAVSQVGCGVHVLAGGSGCGKSLAAWWWLFAEMIDDCRRQIATEDGEDWRFSFRDRGEAFVSAAEVAALDRFDPVDKRRLRVLTSCSRLVIDDLGVEYLDPRGWFLSVFDALIDQRYANRRATVLTTNCDLRQFTSRYGSRIIDRVRHNGAFVACGAKSLRGPLRMTTPSIADVGRLAEESEKMQKAKQVESENSAIDAAQERAEELARKADEEHSDD